MKKTYQNPKTDIVTISVAQMIATSSNNYGQPEQGQDLNTVETTEATSGNLSRRSVWDDEDEEEEY
ncbi:MAG: hypothetical protein IJT53_05020 [Prevotella sp.]|nr:hypothetical protein [Prevotella sp.]